MSTHAVIKTTDGQTGTIISPVFVRIWLALLIAVSLYIRVHGATDYHYSPDEAMHTSIAQGDSPAQVLQFAHDEIHPPMLYILAHYWMNISTDPAFVRGLSLIFGLLTILVYYRIGSLVNGEFTGLCCAALIAFSSGCIIQSYVVRHYMVLIFFLSSAFYYYLRWRTGRSHRMLFFYFLLCIAACLTHFSAVFAIACIALGEWCILLRRKESFRLQLQWLLVNGIIAAIALYAYHLWQPILEPLKSYFATQARGSLLTQLCYMLFYPLLVSGYILPSYAAALVLLIAQLWIVGAPPGFIRNRSGLRTVLFFNALAYGLGMLLVITRLYPEPGTRHSMWVLPFVILAAGWIMADALQWLGSVTLKGKPCALPLLSTLLIVGGFAAYSPATRFHDGSEYVWPEKEWPAFTGYMSQLGPHDLIVTEKDDGIMLANLYPSMGTDAFTGRHMAAIAPYRNTHILFNPYYPRNYSRHVLLATLEEADERHLFDGIDRLIFLRMAWSRSPLTDLMLCGALQKQLIAFPPAADTQALTRSDIYGHFGVVMIVPKEPFLQDILSPGSTTRACLTGEFDKVPALLSQGRR